MNWTQQAGHLVRDYWLSRPNNSRTKITYPVCGEQDRQPYQAILSVGNPLALIKDFKSLKIMFIA
jgi:hypothetical protein